jgi:hypothetical protein
MIYILLFKGDVSIALVEIVNFFDILTSDLQGTETNDYRIYMHGCVSWVFSSTCNQSLYHCWSLVLKKIKKSESEILEKKKN